jgi:hypothetical protein
MATFMNIPIAKHRRNPSLARFDCSPATNAAAAASAAFAEFAAFDDDEEEEDEEGVEAVVDDDDEGAKAQDACGSMERGFRLTMSDSCWRTLKLSHGDSHGEGWWEKGNDVSTDAEDERAKRKKENEIKRRKKKN